MSPLTEPTKLVLKKDSVTATDVNIREVSLLLHGNGTNGSTTIVDSSLNPKTVTAIGDAKISTTQGKFGGSSIAFDAVGDRATVSSTDFAFGTGDFTIELWIYSLDVSSSAQRGLLQLSDAAGGLKTSYSSGIAIAQGVNSISGGATGGIGAAILGTFVGSGATPLTTSAWFHVALTRANGVVRLFVDGIQIGASAVATGSIGAENLVIGGYYSTSYLFNGYMDDIRISRVARYTSNFTPPTAPFPDF